MSTEIVPEDDFIETYLQFTKQTECPTLFNRWTALASLGAYLGRSTYFMHGHFVVRPNLYVMLIGSPGTKKSSAIKIGSKLLKTAGYNTFAAKKTRQEKFLQDLAEQAEELYEQQENNLEANMDAVLEQNIFGNFAGDEAAKYEGRPPAECFIAADEFNNFLGVNNLDFASILGDLWDFEGVYDYRLKNSKSVYIPNPSISILGGNTQTNLAMAFPPEAIGQGFMSRLLLVYGEPSGILFTFPPPPDEALQAKLISKLHEIKESVHGEVKMSDSAEALLDKIYKSWKGIDDIRFEHYRNRRLSHLIKLCMVVSASRCSIVISKEDVVRANTYLVAAETLMPKALGEFGKSRHSAVSHKVMIMIEQSMTPVKFQELWKGVHQDLDDRKQLVEILSNLDVAGKIQSIPDLGYVPKKEVTTGNIEGTVDFSILTQEERDLL